MGLVTELELQATADFDEGGSPSPSDAQLVHAQPGGKRRKKSKKNGPHPGPAAGPLGIVEPAQPERGAGYEPDPALAVLLEELGLGRHRALLDAHEFELESVQISTAADLAVIGLPPDAAACL